MPPRRIRQPVGFAAFEKRIAKLICRCERIPPSEIMRLLMRADAHPELDIRKEFRALQRKYSHSRR